MVLSLALVAASSVSIIYTTLTIEPTLLGLCGEETVSGTPIWLSLMPLNYLVLVAGLANYSMGYIAKIVGKGANERDLKRLLLGTVVAGGSVYSSEGKYCVRFYGKDAVLHNIFSDLCYSIYEVRPQTVKVVSRSSYMTQFYSKAAVNELREFSSEFNIRNGGTPSIQFILEGKPQIKIEAARLTMSISGWINCAFQTVEGGVNPYPRLGLGAVNPAKLNEEYEQLMDDVGVEMDLCTDKRYPGMGYLASCDMGAMTKFAELGGFVDGSTVKRGTFAGVCKNGLLLALTAKQTAAYKTRNDAFECIKVLSDADSRELKMYMNRIMLG